jgi:hypothetical protein
MTFQSHNPATGELIGTYPEHGEVETDVRLQQGPLLASDMSSEPAAGNGFTVEKVVRMGERFNTDLPDAR